MTFQSRATPRPTVLRAKRMANALGVNLAAAQGWKGPRASPRADLTPVSHSSAHNGRQALGRGHRRIQWLSPERGHRAGSRQEQGSPLPSKGLGSSLSPLGCVWQSSCAHPSSIGGGSRWLPPAHPSPTETPSVWPVQGTWDPGTQ